MSKKLESQDFEKLTKLKTDYELMISTLGKMYIEELNLNSLLVELNKNRNELLEELNKLIETEVKFTEELFVKYGGGTFNLDTGEVTENE